MSDVRDTPSGNGGSGDSGPSSNDSEKVACDVCMKEIPVSGAQSMETTDYVIHFCGVDCYSKWMQQNQKPD
ncbi:MAG: DUF3330 domain-containing protein [Gammaproteobacteria bacterium]|nr:DUF3330 domain-containing protein [Gammaproteobacteria bacterium]MDH5799833.1 DUF3330 domain-containing protein [Gammaproteobacteria bacterium]